MNGFKTAEKELTDLCLYILTVEGDFQVLYLWLNNVALHVKHMF